MKRSFLGGGSPSLDDQACGGQKMSKKDTEGHMRHEGFMRGQEYILRTADFWHVGFREFANIATGEFRTHKAAWIMSCYLWNRVEMLERWHKLRDPRPDW
jgi:hypothetical protein